jgi:hypothetical protein
LTIVAALLIGPAFILLYSLQGRRLLSADEPWILPAAAPTDQTAPPAAPPGHSPPAEAGPTP